MVLNRKGSGEDDGFASEERVDRVRVELLGVYVVCGVHDVCTGQICAERWVSAFAVRRCRGRGLYDGGEKLEMKRVRALSRVILRIATSPLSSVSSLSFLASL